MSPDLAWSLLGLEKTSDKRAIKRAYAGKLKGINPDQNARAFIELREAYEQASWQADFIEHDRQDESKSSQSEEEFESIEALGPEFSHVLLERPAAPKLLEHPELENVEYEEEAYLQPEYVADPRDQLAAILWSEDPIGLLESEAVAHVKTIIEDLNIGSVEKAGEIEDWLARLSVETMRRSDCIIPLLVDHFDWNLKAGNIDSHPALETVVSRGRDLAYLVDIRNPAHNDHASFNRLCTGGSEPLSWINKKLHGPDVIDFLYRVREHNSTVEWDFDPGAVEKWGALPLTSVQTEEPKSAVSWYIWLFLAWFLLNVIRLITGWA